MPKPSWWDSLGVRDDGWSSKFQSVDLLLKHLARKSRSVSSRDSYCYIISRLCSYVNLNPDELVSMAREKPDEIGSRIQNSADVYNDRGSTRCANHVIHLAKTFFKVNKIELALHGYFQPARSRLRPEYIPSLSEALKMADVTKSLRDRLIILLLIYTGLRNSTLRALVYDESYPDPLLQEHTIKKEIERNEEYLVIIVHDIMKKTVSDACKNRLFYYAFIPQKVTECFRLYIREMTRKYGAIPSNRPIFVTENRRISLKERLRTPISKGTLEDIVKNAAERAGIKNWEYVYPHCLRKTYESFLRNQPDDLRLDAKEREFLFGHTLPGSQDTYFDKTKIEEMRAKYSKMVFEPVVIETEERVVSDGELQTFLQQGWRFVAALQSGKVVVSKQVSVKQSDDTKTASSTQAANSGIQKEGTQTCPKPPESISPPNSPKVCNDLGSSTNLSITKKGQDDSSQKTNSLAKSAENQSSRNSSSPTENSSTKEGNAQQNSKTKHKQKTLFDFRSLKEN